MKTLIIGTGEVGKSLAEVLKSRYEVWTRDIEPEDEIGKVDVLHICFPYWEGFVKAVRDYISFYQPGMVNIASTVPPGTTRKCGDGWPMAPMICHSTTRGLHPHLAKSMRTFMKHIGSEVDGDSFKAYFEQAGLQCQVHAQPEITELAHIINNTTYGVNLMFADEVSRLCRHYGVDYYQAVMEYAHSNNEGYRKLGHHTKVRPILTPPGGRIGGHCVVQNAQLIPEEVRGPLLNRLAHYNEPEKQKYK